MIAKKIKAMKDNKSAGVDEIPPKLLMETVDQISMPLAIKKKEKKKDLGVTISADMKVS